MILLHLISASFFNVSSLIQNISVTAKASAYAFRVLFFVRAVVQTHCSHIISTVSCLSLHAAAVTQRSYHVVAFIIWGTQISFMSLIWPGHSISGYVQVSSFIEILV